MSNDEIDTGVMREYYRDWWTGDQAEARADLIAAYDALDAARRERDEARAERDSLRRVLCCIDEAPNNSKRAMAIDAFWKGCFDAWARIHAPDYAPEDRGL